MIVSRIQVPIADGHGDDARVVLKELYELWEENLGPVTCRIYKEKVAPFDTLTWEWECESLAEMDRLRAEISALPEAAPVWEKMREVVKHGGTHEVWELVE